MHVDEHDPIHVAADWSDIDDVTHVTRKLEQSLHPIRKKQKMKENFCSSEVY